MKSETQHTPGPWRAVCTKRTAAVKGPECAIYINVATVETDECVARWRADARLIAAAPDLLGALRTLDTCNLDDLPGDVVRMCRAAIAKAEGRR